LETKIYGKIMESSTLIINHMKIGQEGERFNKTKLKSSIKVYGSRQTMRTLQSYTRYTR
jgi:hypothetical protein